MEKKDRNIKNTIYNFFMMMKLNNIPHFFINFFTNSLIFSLNILFLL